jgi:hypothetical protein
MATMKVVAAIAIIAVLFVTFAPEVDQGPVVVRLFHAARHAVRSLVAIVPPPVPRPRLAPSGWRIVLLHLTGKILPATSLLELECSWLC